jgi:hypothetical protein
MERMTMSADNVSASTVDLIRKKTGGRKAGTPNRATAEIKALARQHAPAAVAELARLATSAKSEQAKVAAIKELLDRGYGKSRQSMEVSGSGGIPVEIVSKRQRDAAVAAALRADS